MCDEMFCEARTVAIYDASGDSLCRHDNINVLRQRTVHLRQRLAEQGACVWHTFAAAGADAVQFGQLAQARDAVLAHGATALSVRDGFADTYEHGRIVEANENPCQLRKTIVRSEEHTSELQATMR